MKGLVTKTQQQAKKTPKVKLYPEIDVQTVRDFIDSKATATSYRDALQRLALFIKERHPNHDIESIITPLIQKEVDVYKLLDQLAGYLTDNGLSNGSAKLYMAAVRSFLQYCDVDIIPAKFKHG